MSVGVVREFKRNDESTMIAVLEGALQRAREGKIRAFCLVEIGPNVPQGPPQVRIADAFNDVRDPMILLALAGGLEFHKKEVIDSIEI